MLRSGFCLSNLGFSMNSLALRVGRRSFEPSSKGSLAISILAPLSFFRSSFCSLGFRRQNAPVFYPSVVYFLFTHRLLLALIGDLCNLISKNKQLVVLLLTLHSCRFPLSGDCLDCLAALPNQHADEVVRHLQGACLRREIKRSQVKA